MHYTQHAQQRFAERFPHLIKGGPLISIHECFKRATLDKRFLNNTAHLVYLIDTYGDFDFQFYVNEDVLFVCRNDSVITVMNTHAPYQTTFRMHGVNKSRYRSKGQPA